jgi:uncharacterized protein
MRSPYFAFGSYDSGTSTQHRIIRSSGDNVTDSVSDYDKGGARILKDCKNYPLKIRVNGRFKIFSDPVHGFISVPKGLILDLIDTPEVQRLRRIRQLGIGYLVFPGAEHSRFGHALGAMALMHDCLSSLAEKDVAISPEEHRAAMIAALLHDIGHGPFSHTLENEVISGFRHETMSRVFLADLNVRFKNELTLALDIFDNTYARRFFHDLVSSQLDMDRLDYLRRDSYYTGVVEGRIGVERIIKTMRVHDERIVIESRGMHAVENFLIARRMMYWQVYLHKTILAGDHLLQSIIRRARWLISEGRTSEIEGTSPSFLYFLENRLDPTKIDDPVVVGHYRDLDDTDIIFSLKSWRQSTDNVLSDLSNRVLNRQFFRVRFVAEPTSDLLRENWKDRVIAFLKSSGISTAATAHHDADYYLAFDTSRHEAYERSENSIGVLQNNSVIELSEALEVSALSGLTERESRQYICFPKELEP